MRKTKPKNTTKRAAKKTLAIEKITTKDGGEIIVPFGDLPEMPGWRELTRQQQDSLYTHKRNIGEYEQYRQFGEIGVLVELHQVQQDIEVMNIDMATLLPLLLPNMSDRNRNRKLQYSREIMGMLTPELISQWDLIGRKVLEKYPNLARASLGEMKNATEKVFKLPVPGGITLDVVFRQINDQIGTDRKERRSNPHKDKDDAAIMAAKALIGYIKACGKNLATSTDRRHWLRDVVGWTMEVHAITGTVSTERKPYPEAVKPKLGAPFKNPPKEAD